eukprot:Protomagalhaensia_wolfi_Nauph_80__5567@NODE_617_length_2203_cov_16_246303_g462_i0_p2_GENE_NODE_617_length_2203_cov_16_246303_g462_i0NODE_617_length_2203_cov_16_246303_g462_i0_p2_ORF_typecomplete_len128_score24_36Nsp1_C/PF05064_13/3_4e08Nsp1_C/PF05064_13/4_2Tropomyosin_1/PF12718_7/0_00011DUF16/PF01519_16/0_0067DUF16/PF01519_16/5_2ATG16/PF08614_11/0_00025IFT57/PF10498_9/0_00026HOOK/PF05622_12/0_0018EzrA/PF06160_12/0_012MAD/PF05557_13/0_0064DUF4175/PF13779_6/0_0092AAA_13/PF13166_6/0_012Cluap1/PF102
MRKMIEDFKRYSRAICDTDTRLFQYVDKLHATQKQQSEIESRQQDVIQDVEKIERRQKLMLDAIQDMEKRVADRLPEGRRTGNLEVRAEAVNHQITALEDEVMELSRELEELQVKAMRLGGKTPTNI